MADEISPNSVASVAGKLRLWLGDGEPGIVWVRTPTETLREEVLAKLKRFATIAVAFEPPEAEAAAEWLERELARYEGLVVTVVFPESTPLDAFRHLNRRREQIARMPMSQIWWCPAGLAPDAEAAAPDLASWFKLRLTVGQPIPPSAPAPSEFTVLEAQAAADPAQYLPRLAEALIERSRKGEGAASVADARRALDLYRRAAKANPQAFRTELVGALNNLAAQLQRAGQAQASILYAQEAAQLRAERRVPTVFISSTMEDLDALGYRTQAKDAALAAGFMPVMAEYFAARGDQPSLDKCLHKVAEADVLVVLVAHRYGWVPPGKDKSITWLEVEEARRLGREVIALLVDPAQEWPAEQTERGRLLKQELSPELMAEVQRNEAQLKAFKADLSRVVRRTFTTPHSLRALIGEALSDWLKAHWKGEVAAPGDPEPYLRWLEEETRYLRIHGLRTKRAEPYVFPIDEIYIPLQMAGGRAERDGMGMPANFGREHVPLEAALAERRTVVIGDPGAGKSTFVRRVAFEAARMLRGTAPANAAPFFPPDAAGLLPIYIRAASLASFLAEHRKDAGDYSAEWLLKYLVRETERGNWQVDAHFFRRRLTEGGCLVLIDGLDEAPEPRVREDLARIFEQTCRTYDKNRYLVTTRPVGYSGDATLTGFAPVYVDDLERDQIDRFFQHFATALALTPAQREEFLGDLATALTRPDIRTMARNPVMLTALAVLQHNDARLPEYRVQLYESIIDWLVFWSRKDQPNRVSPQIFHGYLRKLALAMQNAPEGRLTQVRRGQAAEWLAESFTGGREEALCFLEQEELDSGVLISVGPDVKFWHLQFQEYLAAREIYGYTDQAQWETVQPKLYKPEWREVIGLLAGILCLQGTPKVDQLFLRMLKNTASDLPAEARCVALLGAILFDVRRMGYEPPKEYEEMLGRVQCIFDGKRAQEVEIETRIAAADALGLVGDHRFEPAYAEQHNWITIKPDTFTMGEGEGEHQVTLRGYRIGKYPVTVGEYERFVAETNQRRPEDWEEQLQHPNRPVVNVDWHDAAAYCAWNKGRLPTEAEWERAARGSHHGKYPWREGELDHTRANYEMKIGHPTPVGVYPAGNSDEGVCDLMGNVWEWCSDWYGEYPKDAVTDPLGPTKGEYKVLRGDSWNNGPGSVRAAQRGRFLPENRNDLIGFRCLREVIP